MKKVLVLMLILLVTAGVFAQDNVVTIEGEIVTTLTEYTVVKSEQVITNPFVTQEVKGIWNVGSSADLWTELRLPPQETDIGFYDKGGSGSVSLSYFRPFQYANFTFGVNGVSRGGTLGFSVTGAGVEDRYYFRFSGDLVNKYKSKPFSELLGNAEAYASSGDDDDDKETTFPMGFSSGDLFGWYKMFGGMIQLMVSVAGNPGSIASFGDVGGGNLGLNVKLDAISFGFVLPHVFNPTSQLFNNIITSRSVFTQIKFGIAFSSDVVNVDANFDNYYKGDDDHPEGAKNFHFGAGTNIGENISASLWFNGRDVGADVSDNSYWFGLGVSYDGGTFGASLNTEITIIPTPMYIEIKPSFWVKVLPDTLYAGIDAKFGFGDAKVDWELVPTFAWNFLRTGATGSPATGMIIKYTISGNTAGIDKNNVRFTFKWGL